MLAQHQAPLQALWAAASAVFITTKNAAPLRVLQHGAVPLGAFPPGLAVFTPAACPWGHRPQFPAGTSKLALWCGGKVTLPKCILVIH